MAGMNGLDHAQKGIPPAKRAVTTALSCEQCGHDITPHPENATKQRFCSDACRTTWHREHPRRHSHHRMHAHSTEAYRFAQGQLSKRAGDVLAWVQNHGQATDRDVMHGLGFTDPNSVRPRITTLVESGLLVEVGERQDSQTHKTVRVVDVPRGPQQMRLIA